MSGAILESGIRIKGKKMYTPKGIRGNPITLEECKMQVGKGWHGLVEECYDLCVANKLDITQVKEKYGTLRFYVFGGTAELYDKIEDICARSANICEHCGAKGRIIDLGWYYTLCPDCEKRVSNDRKKAFKDFEDLQKRIMEGKD